MAAPEALRAATLGRPLDLAWRRTSYSALTASAHGDTARGDTARGDAADRVGSEPEDPALGDEPEESPGPPGGNAAGPDADLAIGCPLGDLPGGTGVGTWVHAALEAADFAAADPGAELLAGLSVTGEAGTAEAWAPGLAAALGTPLDAGVGSYTLRELRRSDRIDELGFDLPLCGGDRPSAEVTTADLAALFAAHVDPVGPLGGYPERLADPGLAAVLRGYLTGSLDLVWRRSEPDGGQRWYLADYKTNKLAPPGQAATTWHYRPGALDAEMQRRHYPLQALLYAVALHRYLSWRLPGYRPETHLGGIRYLFLRGMVGPATPVVDGRLCGVWAWQPPAELVVGCSELLAGHR